ncbi:MAG TPA: methylated-DNA--[protein]-cysteine S-methyltransferase [Acidimicrobiales bacterium]|nr:methylated-DNA--[protein]-cysteine S-methyltransferase [Acidimicrobiales bacterium]
MSTVTTTPVRIAPMRITLATPVGRIGLEGDDDAITELLLPRDNAARVTAPDAAEVARLPAALRAAVAQLEEYFAGRRRTFDLPVSLAGTEFQCQVWRTLAEIPYGETVSYATLAAMVGRPAAFRAVGQANGANPVPIVLPCHRVVASGGGIGGYGGGLTLKRKLLALEGLTGF